MLLKNKTAVITGSNKGIGKAILNVFSQNGANVISCIRKKTEEFEESISKIEKKYNNKVIIKEVDFIDEEIAKKVGTEISFENKKIDILVNNAGIIETSLFQMTPIKKFKEIFQVNYFSQITFSQQIIKNMIKNKFGSIVYVSSTSGLDGNEGRGAYSDSKAAIISKSKVLSKELGRFNIRVNTVCPGLTNTSMAVKNTSEKNIKTTLDKLSINRMASPEEIANSVLFLSSDLSSYITGQTIRVDGGM
jgi:3-oxoacyl-[acyl-carrier protein] reductase